MISKNTRKLIDQFPLLKQIVIYYGHLSSLNNSFASTSASFELGVYCIIEFITNQKPHLSISTTPIQNHNTSPFHPVNFLLHTDRHNEIRVNIVKQVHKEKYDSNNFYFLRSLITKISNQRPIAYFSPSLRDTKYQDLDHK